MDIRRKVKNVVYKYTEPERLVREATSNDPWGPTSTIMSNIADLTYDYEVLADMMPIIWKRLNDKGKNWRHVYKCIVLIEYLIKCGDRRVSIICFDNIHAIETLKDFQYFDEYKDLGLGIREKSKALVSLLKDEESLNFERERAQNVKEILQGPISYMGSHQQRKPGDLGKEIRKQLSREKKDPNSSMKLNINEMTNDEADEVVRKVIELSREGHEAALKPKNETERLEDLKLTIALEQSKEEEALSVLRPPPKSSDATMSLKLLNISNLDISQTKPVLKSKDSPQMQSEIIGFGNMNKYDPWALSSTYTNVNDISLDFDPWKTTPELPVRSNGNISTPSDTWPKETTYSNETIIDRIFGEEKPSVDFEKSLSVDTHKEEKASDLVSLWMEPQGSSADVVECTKYSSSPAAPKKCPLDFLGDNGKLVNLEHLLPAPTAGVYWDPSSVNYGNKNPFAPGNSVSGNPFNNNSNEAKRPMNAMTISGQPRQPFQVSGNMHPSNIDNNYNSFTKPPQPLAGSSPHTHAWNTHTWASQPQSTHTWAHTPASHTWSTQPHITSYIPYAGQSSQASLNPFM